MGKIFSKIKAISTKKKVVLFAVIVLLSFFSKMVFAMYPLTIYEPGDTLNPACVPSDSDPNCNVRPPLTSLNISDAIYGASWDGDATHAPSKNAVYDQIEALIVGGHNPVTIGATPNGLSLATQVLSLALASTSTIGALSSTDWNTFNGKQDALNGTGFVKISGTTISYDNSTFLTAEVDPRLPAPSTAGNLLTSNGSIWTSAAAPDLSDYLKFSDLIIVSPLTYQNGHDTQTGYTIGIPKADAVTDGYLDYTDWSTFNGKLSSESDTLATVVARGNTSGAIAVTGTVSGAAITGTGPNALTSIGIKAVAYASKTALQAETVGGTTIYAKQIGAMTANSTSSIIRLDRTYSGGSTYGTSGDVIQINDNPTTLAANTGYFLRGTVDLKEEIGFVPRVADGASATAYWFDTNSTLSTSGAKLFSLRNNGLEKFSVGYDGVISSAVTTGTAPLTVASTTVVTNLNADLLDGNHASAFATTGSLSSYMPKAGGTFTGDVFMTGLNPFIIANNGSGTTATMSAGFGHISHYDDGMGGSKDVQLLYSGLQFTNDGYMAGVLVPPTTMPAGTLTWTLPAASGTVALTSDIPSLSGYIPYTGATGNVDLGIHNFTVDTNSLFVDATNHRVGIGTTAPATLLEVSGTGATDPNGIMPLLLKLTSSAVNGGIKITGTGTSSAAYLGLDGNGDGFFGTAVNAAANLRLFAGSGEKVRISSGGNVGIGTSTFGTNNKFLLNPYNIVDNLATAQISTTVATNKGLVVQGFTGQTANLQEWQDSTGAVKANVDKDGYFTVGSKNTIYDSEIQIKNNSNDVITRLMAGELGWGTGGSITWRNNIDARAGSTDLGLARSAAGILKVTDGGAGDATAVKIGSVYIGGWPADATYAMFTNDAVANKITGYGFIQSAAGHTYFNGSGISFNIGAANYMELNPNLLTLVPALALNWSTDTGLARSSAGVLKVTDGSTGLGDLTARYITASGSPVLDTTPVFSVTRGNSGVIADFNNTGWGSYLAITANSAHNPMLQAGSGDKLSFAANGHAVADMMIDTTGNVGIGTTAPKLALHVFGQYGAPASSGTTPTGIAMFANQGANNLYFGANSASPYGLWMQASDATDLSLTYPILLNPRGGNVGIGTSTFGTNNKFLLNPYNTVDNLATAQISTTVATNKGLVVQGFTSQSANLQEWQDSTGAVVANVRANGYIDLPFIIGTGASFSGTSSNGAQFSYWHAGLTLGGDGTIGFAPTGSAASTAPDVAIVHGSSPGILKVTDGSTGGGKLQTADGLSSAPAYSFASETNTGMYHESNALSFAVAGTRSLYLTSTSVTLGGLLDFAGGGPYLGWQSGTSQTWLRLGNANSATPLSQSITVQGSRGGTDTNIAGGNLTLQSGLGTGNATGSTISFFTPDLQASGTTAQTATAKMTILGNGNVGIGTTAPKANLAVGTYSGDLGMYGAEVPGLYAVNSGQVATFNEDFPTSWSRVGIVGAGVQGSLDAGTTSVGVVGWAENSSSSGNAIAGFFKAGPKAGISDAGSNFYGIYSVAAKNYFSGNVGIGTATFGTNNKFLLNPYNTVDNLATAQISTTAATNKGLVVQGFTGQTANLQEWQDSSGNAMAFVGKSPISNQQGIFSHPDTFTSNYLVGIVGVAGNAWLELGDFSTISIGRYGFPAIAIDSYANSPTERRVLINGAFAQVATVPLEVNGTALVKQLNVVKADSSALTDLLINPTAKTSGNLIDAQVGGVSKFSVNNTGKITSAAGMQLNDMLAMGGQPITGVSYISEGVVGNQTTFYGTNIRGWDNTTTWPMLKISPYKSTSTQDFVNFNINSGVDGVDGATVFKVTNAGIVTLGNSLKILEGGATPTKYTIFQGGDQTVDITYTLPTAVAAATGYVLSSTDAGVLSWVAGGAGGGVPYTGATGDVDLGVHSLSAQNLLVNGATVGTSGVGVISLAYGTPPTSSPAAGTVQLYADYAPSSTSAVPQMTSNTDPSGVVSAESSYGSTPPWKAFNDAQSGWINNGTPTPTWLQYQFPSSTIIISYSIRPWDADNFPYRSPTSWEFQGSNDGTSWTTLDTRSGFTGWTINTYKQFDFMNSTAYVYYRLYITANLGETYTGIHSLRLFGQGERVLYARGGLGSITRLDNTSSFGGILNSSGLQPYTGGTSNLNIGAHNLTVDTNSLFVDSVNHRVGIGNIAPSTMLTVGTATTNTGNITVYGTGTTCTIGDGTGGTNCTSDARLKDNVVNLGSELANIMALRPITFTWTDKTKNQTTNTGLIAQEVQAIYPTAVHTVYDDYLGIDYAALVVPTIKAVQELNLNLEGIAGTTIPFPDSPAESFVTAFLTNIKTTIGTWLADATNGITSIFAHEVNTNTLCVSDDTGAKTCLTKAELDALLAGVAASGGEGGSGSGGGSGTPTVPTCTPPQTLVNNVCTDSTPVVPVCTPPQTLVNNVCTDPVPEIPVCASPQTLVNNVCTDPTPLPATP